MGVIGVGVNRVGVLFTLAQMPIEEGWPGHLFPPPFLSVKRRDLSKEHLHSGMEILPVLPSSAKDYWATSHVLGHLWDWACSSGAWLWEGWRPVESWEGEHSLRNTRLRLKNKPLRGQGCFVEGSEPEWQWHGPLAWVWLSRWKLVRWLHVKTLQSPGGACWARHGKGPWSRSPRLAFAA